MLSAQNCNYAVVPRFALKAQVKDSMTSANKTPACTHRYLDPFSIRLDFNCHSSFPQVTHLAVPVTCIGRISPLSNLLPFSEPHLRPRSIIRGDETHS